MYKNYQFNKEEDLDRIKIDISFLKKNKITEEELTSTTLNQVSITNNTNSNANESNASTELITTEDKNYGIIKQSIAWTKVMLCTFPEIKPLIQVLKRFLKIKNLNSPHKGT